MKPFKLRFLFALVAVVAAFSLFACKGNGKKKPVVPKVPQEQAKPDDPKKPDEKKKPEETKEKVVLKFDGAKIVVKNESKQNAQVSDGQDVEVGTKLGITMVQGAKDADKIFDGFRLNEKKRLNEGDKYVVSATDAVEDNGKKVIRITFVEREKVKVKIIFAQNITASITKNGNQTSINSGDMLNEGVLITFTAPQLDASKLLDSWLLNDVSKGKGDAGNKFSYTVNASDAKDNNGIKEIAVKFTEREIKTVKLHFDAGTIDGVQKKKSDGTFEAIGDGVDVKTGDVIRFSVKDSCLLPNKKFAHFTLNNEQNTAIIVNEKQGTYEVDDRHAKTESGTLVIRLAATVRERITAKLRFAESEIKVILYDSSSGHQTIKHNNDVVREGDEILCVLQDGDRLVERWLLNSIDMPRHPNNQQICRFVVSPDNVKQEGGEYILHITVEKQVATPGEPEEKLTLKFVDPINCSKKQKNGQRKDFSNRDEVKVGDQLFFYIDAQLVGRFDHWKVGNESKTSGEDYGNDGKRYYFLQYTVDKSHANTQNELEVKAFYTPKQIAKAKLKLLKTTIDVQKLVRPGQQPTRLSDGAEVNEGDMLVFRIRDGAEQGRIVGKWLVNGKEVGQGKEVRGYIYPDGRGCQLAELTATSFVDEAGEKVLKVDYELRELAKAKLKLLKGTIEVDKIVSGQRNPLQNGAEVSEGDELQFRLKHDAEQGKIVDKWLVNGEKVEEGMQSDGRGFSFWRLKAQLFVDEAGEKVLKVDYELREPQDIIIRFDASKIEIQKRGQHGPESLASGDKVKEGTHVEFKAKDGIYVEKWKFNNVVLFDRVQHSALFMNLARAKPNGSGELEIEVSIEERAPIQIAIKFDSDKIKCEKDGVAVASGEKFLEGTTLKFTPKGVQAGDSLLWRNSRNNGHIGHSTGTAPFNLAVFWEHADNRNATPDQMSMTIKWVKQ